MIKSSDQLKQCQLNDLTFDQCSFNEIVTKENFSFPFHSMDQSNSISIVSHSTAQQVTSSIVYFRRFERFLLFRNSCCAMSPSATKKSVHRPGALKQQNKPVDIDPNTRSNEVTKVSHRGEKTKDRGNSSFVSFTGRGPEKKHERSLKCLNVVSKANHAVQLRKPKLLSEQQTRQTIGSTPNSFRWTTSKRRNGISGNSPN